MSRAFRYVISGLVTLTLCFSSYLAALAQETAPLNGLPDPISTDQFVYVPLLDTLKPKSLLDSQKHTPRVVLALGGGGMRGAAHIGVLKILIKAGIPIDGIAGTSMGAVVGGLYAAGIPLPEIERRFVSGSLMRSFAPIPVGFRIILAPITSSPRLIGFHPYDGLYFGTTFHRYLDHAIPADKATIESLNVPFSAVAIDLCDGHPYAIKKGSLVDAMRASSAVPSLRKPIQIGDKLFVDGGVLANLPVAHARELGGDVVIAVQVDETFNRKVPDDFRKAGSVAIRMLDLQLSALDGVHGRKADIVIHPNVDGVRLMSTKKSDAKRSIAAGESAAEAALPEIRQKLQTFGIAEVPHNI